MSMYCSPSFSHNLATWFEPNNVHLRSRSQRLQISLSRNNHYTTPVLAACIIVVVSFQPQLECCGMQGGVIGWPRVDQPAAESLISLSAPCQSTLWEHTRAQSYLYKLISLPRLCGTQGISLFVRTSEVSHTFSKYQFWTITCKILSQRFYI